MAIPYDPVQEVVAQAIQSMSAGSEAQAGLGSGQTRGGAISPTTPSTFNLYAGQGAGGFGQGSAGTQPRTRQPGQETRSVF